MELGGDGGAEARVGVYAEQVLDDEGIVSLDLVAWTGTNLDDFAVGLSDEGGDDCGVFVGDEPFGWTVSGWGQIGGEERGQGLVQVSTRSLVAATSRIRCG